MAARRPELSVLESRALPAGAGEKVQSLQQTERIRLGLEILRAYAQARRALRRDPIATVVAGLRAQSPALVEPSDGTREQALRLGSAVTRLLTHLPGDTRCLTRSLVLTRLLARRGIQAKLVIGARAKPTFLAHAWVEHNGDPVLSPGDESFGRLVEL